MEIFADKYGSADNFSQAFYQAVREMKNGDTLVFEKKTYHFYKDFCASRNIHMTNTDSFKNPCKYFALLFENLEDITIDGRGAVFCIHGDICALAVLSCKNVKLKDFTINYYSPSNVELTVTAVKGNRITYDIPETTSWYVDGNDVVFFDQSPFTKNIYWQFKNDENSWCSVFHGAEDVHRTLHFKAPFAKVKNVERKSPTQLEITYTRKRKFEVGDTYAFSENKNRNTSGVFVNESSGVSAENINVNYLQGFGWLSQMCENVSFSNICFKADEKHHVSSFADLIHICGCKGKVNIKNCYFEHPHDDAINIHGAFLRFKERKDSNTAVFEFVHRQQGGYRAFYKGNLVKLYYRNSLQELNGVYTVENAVDDIENKTVTVRFKEKLPEKITAKYLSQSNVVAENISYCPDVEISDCEFRAIPTRGILCTTSGKVRIHDNTFSHVAMAHVFVSNDAADWYESGPVRDMEIYSNKFHLQPTKQYEQMHCPAILVKPITLGRRVTKPIHKNIKIYSNLFIVGRDKPIKAIGVDGLDIYSNSFEGSSKISLKCCKKAK